MSRKKVPPRLFVIFAREAHEAIIFRRGPTSWYHVVRWDTQHDKFYPGAWIRGRIYPEKCDLSPNGRLLLYFVHQGRKLDTDYTHAWSAVSRSPYLEALGLWPLGTTYGGGGRFIDNRSLILRHDPSGSHTEHPGVGLNISFSSTNYGDAVPHYESSAEVRLAEWSGRDQRGRLIYALDGQLIWRKKPSKDFCLADFNECIPNPEPAPEWATRPLC